MELAAGPAPVEETTQDPAPLPVDDNGGTEDGAQDPVDSTPSAPEPEPTPVPPTGDFRTMTEPTSMPRYESVFITNSEGQVTAGGGTLHHGASGQSETTFIPPTDDEPGAIRLQAPEFGHDRTYTGWNPDQGGLVADGLTLVSAPLSAGGADLDYLHYGFWTVPMPNGGTYRAAIATGFETPAAAIPATGTLSYRGSIVGHFTSNTGTGVMLGDVSLQVDFAAQQVDRLDLAINYYGASSLSGSVAQASFTDLPMVDGRFGPDAGSGFAYVGEDGHILATAGDVMGAFYGPDAQEAGGVWNLTGEDGLLASGSFGAAVQP